MRRILIMLLAAGLMNQVYGQCVTLDSCLLWAQQNDPTDEAYAAEMMSVWELMGQSGVMSAVGKTLPDLYMRQFQSKMSTESQVQALYFGILLLEEQQRYMHQVDSLLSANQERARELLSHHLLQQGDVDALEVEKMTIEQKYEQMSYSSMTSRRVLSMLVGRNMRTTKLAEHAYDARKASSSESSEIARMRKAVENDDRVISQRIKAREEGEAKYSEGKLITSALIQLITDECNAKVTRSIHKLDLIKALYEQRK